MRSRIGRANKSLAFTAFSTFTFEDIELVDQLTSDGRANLLDVQPDRPGGMCVHSLSAVRRVDDDAPVGMCSLVGEADRNVTFAAVSDLRLADNLLMAVPGKRTNRNRVSLDANDNKQIVRLERGITMEDLTPMMRQAAKDQLAASRAALLGNLDPQLTADLIESARAAGTYTGLCAGARQFGQLQDLHPHALFLNLAEARLVVGANGQSPEQVFELLLEKTAAEHVVVMTAGSSPAYVASVLSGRQWVVTPPKLPACENQFGRPDALGCGDTMSGICTFLLGQCGKRLDDDHIDAAVRFAQHVVTVHMTANLRAQRELREYYRDIAPRFGLPMVAPPASDVPDALRAPHRPLPGVPGGAVK